MTAFLALAIAVALFYLGYTRTRSFSRRRLRYTRIAENPGWSGFVAGVGTALVATPLVVLAPIIGTGTAMALGLGVGTGLIQGIRDPVH
jgi:hypothetical protein